MYCISNDGFKFNVKIPQKNKIDGNLKYMYNLLTNIKINLHTLDMVASYILILILVLIFVWLISLIIVHINDDYVNEKKQILLYKQLDKDIEKFIDYHKDKLKKSFVHLKYLDKCKQLNKFKCNPELKNTDILDYLADNYHSINNFSDAILIYYKSYNIKKNLYPVNHQKIIDTLDKLMIIYSEIGDLYNSRVIFLVKMENLGFTKKK